MTYQQFEVYSEADKEEILWKNGRFLINFNEGTYTCDIYELFSFYVSLCYELNINKKAKIVASIHPDALPSLIKQLKLQ